MDATLGLAGIAGLLFVKEAGLPVPVPGDIVVLSAGVAAANGDIDPAVGLPLIVGATIAGGIVQFGLLRGPARALLLGGLRRVGISPTRIELAGDRLRRRGARGVAVARMTPGVRVVAIAAAALAAVGFGRFAAGLAAGNAVFVAGHFALGFAVGKPALAAASTVGGLAIGLVGLAGVGALGWWALARWRVARDPSQEHALALDETAAASWADAACPACLVLAAVGLDRD